MPLMGLASRALKKLIEQKTSCCSGKKDESSLMLEKTVQVKPASIIFEVDISEYLSSVRTEHDILKWFFIDF